MICLYKDRHYLKVLRNTPVGVFQYWARLSVGEDLLLTDVALAPASDLAENGSS